MREIAVLMIAWAVTTAAPQQPRVDDLLKAGRAYVAAYGRRISATVLDEKYTLLEVSTGRMNVPTRIGSDLVLLNVNGQPTSLRDSYSINGAKIREAQPRIPAALAPLTVAAWDQARGYARESQRHFLAEIVLHLNDPLLALRFMSPQDPARFTYAIEGRKKLNGVDVVGLRFLEHRGEQIKYVLGTRGNAAISGRFFMDPSTGAIHQTELFAESKSESGRVIVTYAPAPGLDFLVPSKTVETYQQRESEGGPSNMGVGGYGASQKFEAKAEYSNPRHTPLDLARISG